MGAYASETNVDDWLLAEAPLTAHTNLLANKVIPDPFRGVNEQEVRWVAESEWWYRKEVFLSADLVCKDAIELVFESLDTVATIWVNDVKVGEANNMFTPWRFNIKNVAKVGKNLVVIRFKPIAKVAGELERQHKHKYVCLSADNYSARPYVRKAQYSFGWDWGPTLPTAGIWREAKIVAYNTARLGYVAALPIEVSKDKAKVKLTAVVQACRKAGLNVKFSLVGFGQRFEQDVGVEVSEGRNFVECIINVNEPKLWWPKGYGEPSLYDATVKLYSDSELLDEVSAKAGIRSVELIQEPDEEGKTFIFRINGLNVFCKGANWIPADSFLPKVNFEQYNNLLSYASEANFNMLRVWGGGVYEADVFYNLCDALGIMVWQDFMYVCAGYPEEEWFLREAEREAMEAVLRLRRHPSIVVWCGNNENQWLHNVLWRQRDKVERLYGSQIYESLLLKVIQTLDPTRPYRPSSPFGGADASGRHEGDRHNWEVWSQGIDYPAYLEDNGRFISEFGWQAAPSMELLTAYLEDQDLNPNSPAFRAHEKQTGGLELLKNLLSLHYPVPEDLKRFVLYSQLNQGEALKTAVTHWRSRMFKTSGCLIWQLNDCWPVVSWSLIDYGLNPKAGYFFVKRSFQPVIAPLIVKDGKVQVYVVNETAEALDATLKLQVLTFKGKVLYNQETYIATPPYTARLVLEKVLDWLELKENCLIAATLEKDGKELFEDIRTVVEPKNLKLPAPQISVKTSMVSETRFEVVVETEVYAKAVKLQLNGVRGAFNDNFFDLLPRRPKKIECTLSKRLTHEEFKEALFVETYPYDEKTPS
ncbi:MAG: glycoside hydrolase family 2 protein [Candidatus Bathyarchaeota archaeon]|nr:glycoside hydrolase family 2 protein [Candidatus Bathyarchaeota archaeon]